ncbi:hypothetical protein OAE63_00545 [bacterium]|nr:hypothetical protein [bacterium]
MISKQPILERQALHARKLTIVNPQTGKEMTFEAPLPDDLQRTVDCLEESQQN